ncbi:MAG: hypothetical protein ACI9EB_000871 [Pseudomonas sp.]|jgi:hypothetical protein
MKNLISFTGLLLISSLTQAADSTRAPAQMPMKMHGQTQWNEHMQQHLQSLDTEGW